jgi:hypothetical protein
MVAIVKSLNSNHIIYKILSTQTITTLLEIDNYHFTKLNSSNKILNFQILNIYKLEGYLMLHKLKHKPSHKEEMSFKIMYQKTNPPLYSQDNIHSIFKMHSKTK